LRDEVPKSPRHPVSDNGVAHSLAHDETCLARLVGFDARVQHQTAAPASDAAPHHGTKLVATPQTSVGW
jgi:hypothetical protein